MFCTFIRIFLSIGPLPDDLPLSVTSKFSTGIKNNRQMTTFSQGYFPMVPMYMCVCTYVR